MNMIDKAREFAIERHGNQSYGQHPYWVHLDDVAKLAADFGERAVVISYLHDVVEDTPTTIKEIQENFSEFVADCVEIVTDEPGETRKLRKAKTYKKMASVHGELELALIVKAADRLANIKASLVNRSKKHMNMYQSEHDCFKKSAYRPGLCEALWSEMDKLIDKTKLQK
ncbi:MAG: HD domain-containing protein [Cellvibrionaceae bacterium]|nr:HD domain-containing protein [Cellvibrionaceae bacterium]